MNLNEVSGAIEQGLNGASLREYPGRHTCNGQQVGDIRNNHGPSTYRHLPAYLYELPNTSTDTYPAQIPNSDAASQTRTWTDMNTLSQHAVMINTATGIENSPQTNPSIGIDDNASEDHRSSLERGIAADCSCWVH